MGHNTFTYEERLVIEKMLKNGAIHKKIGDALGRSKSGICYEIHRGKDGDKPYSAEYSHNNIYNHLKITELQKSKMKKGALHRQLGIPEDERIPIALLKEASHAPGKLGKRARMALTLRRIRSS